MYTLGRANQQNSPVPFGIYLCIKDIPSTPASLWLNNPEYFRPFWYYNAITNLQEYYNDVLSNSQDDRVVLSRVIFSVLQRKFGTGILVASPSKNDGLLDLNVINKTGRYLVFIEDYNSVANFPPAILNSIQTSPQSLHIVRLYGLDVFAYGLPNGQKHVLQVLYGNLNNKVLLAVRHYNATTNNWTNWQIIRSQIDAAAVNTYLSAYDNIFQELFNGTRKQSFGLRLEAVQQSAGPQFDTYYINFDFIRNSIFREMHSLLITYMENVNNIYYNAIIPIPNGVNPNNVYNVSLNGTIVQIRIDNSNNTTRLLIDMPKNFRIVDVLALS